MRRECIEKLIAVRGPMTSAAIRMARPLWTSSGTITDDLRRMVDTGRLIRVTRDAGYPLYMLPPDGSS